MVVEVRLPGPLQSLVGGARVVSSEGESVGAVLENISERFPGFRDRILGADGSIHRFVNVYVNDEDVRFLGGLTAPVETGDVVAILPALAGG